MAVKSGSKGPPNKTTRSSKTPDQTNSNNIMAYAKNVEKLGLPAHNTSIMQKLLMGSVKIG